MLNIVHVNYCFELDAPFIFRLVQWYGAILPTRLHNYLIRACFAVEWVITKITSLYKYEYTIAILGGAAKHELMLLHV